MSGLTRFLACGGLVAGSLLVATHASIAAMAGTFYMPWAAEVRDL